MFGPVRSELRRRCFAVAVKAFNGGRRWEFEGGLRIGARKRACGGGRDCAVSARERSERVGVVIFALIPSRYCLSFGRWVA